MSSLLHFWIELFGMFQRYEIIRINDEFLFSKSIFEILDLRKNRLRTRQHLITHMTGTAVARPRRGFHFIEV
jgi:hypothetical protein